MVRPLRIEYPSALYHVTARGNERKNIFLSDHDGISSNSSDLTPFYYINFYMKLKPSDKIYTSNSKIKNAGRGVFAGVDLNKGDLIERCPVIYTKRKDRENIDKTLLYDYYFANRELDRAAIALGFGSIYNHSYEPNATYKKYLEDGYIDFVAIKEIKNGDEVTVNYNYGDPDDKSTLWTDSIPPAHNSTS